MPEVVAAYNMMMSIVNEYVEDANYFTIEFKNKFSVYDIKSHAAKSDDKEIWKQFFAETYAK